ncbi:MAG TPA: ribosomal-protein-alanine N-acetyltransferase RimI, partial [Acidimicrobiia bacterium]|nr:ribosomal-protein-alanine N-acetyltransferase RimI [Acidimicrobiia bacterium]
GARHLTLEVRTRNEAARALYASLGMVPVGIRPGYYGDDDALIMWAHDIDDPSYLEGLRRES